MPRQSQHIGPDLQHQICRVANHAIMAIACGLGRRFGLDFVQFVKSPKTNSVLQDIGVMSRGFWNARPTHGLGEFVRKGGFAGIFNPGDDDPSEGF